MSLARFSLSCIPSHRSVECSPSYHKTNINVLWHNSYSTVMASLGWLPSRIIPVALRTLSLTKVYKKDWPHCPITNTVGTQRRCVTNSRVMLLDISLTGTLHQAYQWLNSPRTPLGIPQIMNLSPTYTVSSYRT